MLTTAYEYYVPEFLECAGARLRGHNRADCPWCGGRRTICYTDEVYFCHRCGRKGNGFTLARELGLARRLPKSEYQAQKRIRERTRQTAEALARRVNDRRRLLATAERAMHKALAAASAAGRKNADNPAVWEALAAIYEQLPRVRAEWVFLSYGPAVAVIDFLLASPQAQDGTLDAVTARGGVYDDAGRFVEIPT